MRALALLLIAAPVFADQSLPEQKPVGDWKGNCVERMETARAELLRRERTCSVYTVAHERSVPGDPTSQQTVDRVVLLCHELTSASVDADGEHRMRADDAAVRPIVKNAVDDCLKIMKKRK